MGKGMTPRDRADARSEVEEENIIWMPGRKMYRVRIGINGSNRSFGYYTDLLEARKVRDLVYLRIGRDLPAASEIHKLSDTELDKAFDDYKTLFERLDEVLEAEPRTPARKAKSNELQTLKDEIAQLHMRVTALEEDLLITKENLVQQMLADSEDES